MIQGPTPSEAVQMEAILVAAAKDTSKWGRRKILRGVRA